MPLQQADDIWFCSDCQLQMHMLSLIPPTASNKDHIYIAGWLLAQQHVMALLACALHADKRGHGHAAAC